MAESGGVRGLCRDTKLLAKRWEVTQSERRDNALDPLLYYDVHITQDQKEAEPRHLAFSRDILFSQGANNPKQLQMTAIKSALGAAPQGGANIATLQSMLNIEQIPEGVEALDKIGQLVSFLENGRIMKYRLRKGYVME